MNTFLKKAKETPKPSSGKYEYLNLTDNPFPVTPYVNKNVADNRYNGRIYEIKIREKEHRLILNNFLKISQNDPNHIRLGYILDQSYVGRGNGKSAFTLNLLDEINKDFCLDISKSVNKCFGLLVIPESSGRTKTFESFIDLIFNEILEKKIIQYCLACLRLEAILHTHPSLVGIEKEFKDDNEFREKLNNQKWFDDKKIDFSKITNYIASKEEFTKVRSDFPVSDKNNNLFFNATLKTESDFIDYYSLTLKSSEKSKFIFNDLVLFFIASGFNGAYIIVDDFERIPDFQSEKLKQEFALDLRTNFFDGYLENAKFGFYNLILVLHAGVPRLVEKAWAVSGMDRRSPILGNLASKHIIKFDKLSVEHSYLLLGKYLSQYRLKDNVKSGELLPFTKEAISLISEKSELNAASILEKAHNLIENAVKDQIKLIDLDFVKKYIGKQEEVDKGAHNIIEEDSTDLFAKAKTKKK